MPVAQDLMRADFPSQAETQLYQLSVSCGWIGWPCPAEPMLKVNGSLGAGGFPTQERRDYFLLDSLADQPLTLRGRILADL